MNDAEILKKAWSALMEDRVSNAKALLDQSSTPAVRAFAQRCVGDCSTNFPQIRDLRNDIVAYGRMFGIPI